jgi:hypothetical protein
LRENDEEWCKKKSSKISKTSKYQYENGRKIIVPDWNGKHHSQETKEKMRLSAIGKQVGERNSQFGTCWITKDDTDKKIKKQDLDLYIDNGWKLGRSLNH